MVFPKGCQGILRVTNYAQIREELAWIGVIMCAMRVWRPEFARAIAIFDVVSLAIKHVKTMRTRGVLEMGNAKLLEEIAD